LTRTKFFLAVTRDTPFESFVSSFVPFVSSWFLYSGSASPLGSGRKADAIRPPA
jgi:hypothetical protein